MRGAWSIVPEAQAGGRAMPLQQSIAAFQGNTHSTALGDQLRQDLRPLARRIVSRACYKPGFRGSQLTDTQLRELKDTYGDNDDAVVEQVIEKVIKRPGFVYQSEHKLASYAGKMLKADIRKSFKEKQYQSHVNTERAGLNEPAKPSKAVAESLIGDPVCKRSSHAQNEMIAKKFESLMLEEMSGMTTMTSMQKLAVYFSHTINTDQWLIISEKGWVKLATAAGLTAHDGQLIAQLAGNPASATALWKQFTNALGKKSSDHLGRVVNEVLEIQVNSRPERFNDVMQRLAKKAVEDTP